MLFPEIPQVREIYLILGVVDSSGFGLWTAFAQQCTAHFTVQLHTALHVALVQFHTALHNSLITI